MKTMKSPLFRLLARLLPVFLFLAFSAKIYAAPADLLSQAYTTLSQADHDYKGHRVAAMKQIAAAAKVLGVTLSGDGKTREKQGSSDQQLRTAQGLLQQASSGLSGKALKHVNAAEKQLSIALKIK